MYTYLAGHVGRSGNEGAFRVLERGYNHWASGHIQEILINTNCPPFCYVKCKTNPSMKSGTYVVYILLKGNGGIASIASAMCDCAAGFVHNLVKIWQKYWQIRDNFTIILPPSFMIPSLLLCSLVWPDVFFSAGNYHFQYKHPLWTIYFVPTICTCITLKIIC